MVLKDFTFVWRIENFNYYWQKANRVQILSPEFYIHGNAGTTKWRLLFSDRPYICHDLPIIRSDKYITLYILRTDDNKQDSFTRIINISLMMNDKYLYYYWREKPIKITDFEKVLSRKAEKFLNRDDLFSDSALILVCRIRKPQSTLNFVEEQCFARNLLAVECLYFVAVIEEFSDLNIGLKRTIPIKPVSSDLPIFIMNVSLLYDDDINIRISVEADFIHLCFCKMFALKNSENWKECGQDSEWRKFGEVAEFALNLDFNTFIKQNYLQNGALTLKCEVAYTTEEEPQRTETIRYGLDPSEILQQKSPCVKRTPAPETKKGDLQSPPTLSEDLDSLYKDGILHDIKLRTKTEIFPAHKVVLSARSPVFKKMFTTDTKEKTAEYVDIQDLKANIVRQLLEFIYKDRVDIMGWQNAKELYLAADKYQIVSLKLKCSSFLKLNIQPSNCCDYLLLLNMTKTWI